MVRVDRHSMAVLNRNSTCYLEYLINFSLTQLDGGGMKLLFSWRTRPNLVGRGSLPKFPDTWRNEISPSTSFRWNIIWHKHKAQK